MNSKGNLTTMTRNSHFLAVFSILLSPCNPSVTDVLLTWHPLTTSSPMASANLLKVTGNPFVSGNIFALGYGRGQIWQSHDNGKSWKAMGASFPSGVGVSDITFQSEKIILVTLVKGDTFQGIARTKDGGNTWAVQSGPEQGLPILNLPGRAQSIVAVKDKSSTIYLSAGGKVYTSTDSGSNWGRITRDDDATDSAAAKVATVTLAGRSSWGGVVFGGEAGVWFVHPEGYLRELKSPGPNITKVAVDQIDRVYAISVHGDAPGLYQFDNDTWKKLKADVFPADVAVDPDNPNHIILVSGSNSKLHHPSSIWISSDAGSTWSQTSAGLPALSFDGVSFDPHNKGRVLLATSRGIWTADWR